MNEAPASDGAGAHRMVDSYPPHWPPRLLHHHFLQHAPERGDAVAVVHGQQRWSYRELAEHARRYAAQLAALPLSVGDRVVLQLDACPQAIALIIACSMRGLVFVPVSPDTPAERVQHITALAEARLLVSRVDRGRPHDMQGVAHGVLQGDALTVHGGVVAHRAAASWNTRVLETDLAYIIFTSGTTGVPKGIMMSHRAALAFFRALVEHCQLSPDARIGTSSPLQFDFSLLDMGLAFGTGACLVQVPGILVHSPRRFLGYLERHGVTQMNGVPSIWSLLFRTPVAELPRLTCLRSILYAGEYFPVDDLRRMPQLAPGITRIINCFGQSESIACCFFDVPIPFPAHLSNVPIARAHPGAEMLLLDERQRPVTRPGDTAEIYLRGAALFSGYWKDAQATNAKLVPNPLRPDSGERVFRTGDMVAIGERGELFYLGRRDTQVQIHGNRVEIEEVERKLDQLPAVDKAVVVVESQPGGDSLTAFVLTSGDSRPTASDLRAHCAQSLSRYMIPSAFVFISSLPYTDNGKIDRHALLTSQRQRPSDADGPAYRVSE